MSEEREPEQGSTRRAVGFDDLPALFDTVLDESATGAMVFDRELRIVYVNAVAARIGGFSADAPVGQRLGDVHPQIAAQAEPVPARAFDEGEPVHNQELVWESARPPHERRWWLATFVPLQAQDGTAYVAVVFVETTEVRRAHDRLSRLIDALPTFVGMCTPEGTVVEANEAALTASGLTREELVGNALWNARWWSHDPEVRGRIRDAVSRAQGGEASRFDVAVRIADDEIVTIDFQLVPIVEHGTVTALVPSAMEVSERVAERDRLRALAELSRHLNGAITSAQAADLVVAHAPAVVDAPFVNVALVDHLRRQLRIVQATDPDVQARWAVLPVDGVSTPLHDAMAARSVLFVDRAERAARYPAMVADTELVGLDTTAAVPLVDQAGQVFGAIGVGWESPLPDRRPIEARLELLADLCSHALRRVQRTEAQDRLVRELQDEVLHTPSHSHRLDIAVRYEPAQTEIGFGGDWYDVIEVDDERTVCVVGDVTGHGIPAAARMTEAKATIRALALTSDLPHVVPAATRSLAHLESGFVATVALAWVDAAAEEVSWRLAGHPPPVLRRPGRPTLLLPGPQHPPIGMPTRAQAVAVEPFPPGSLLVLYTDGLVERRDEEIDVGLERLRAVVDALPELCSADDAARALLRELHAADSDDDVALVVVRNP